MDHVERLVTTDRTWRELRARVETATRKVDLRQVEDQVDAVVCAYVALFAERWPERTTTYGDFERGYIVTPTLPDAHATIRSAVEEYTRSYPTRVQDAHEYVALVTEILDEAGINYLTVTGRAKSIESFAAKAGRTKDGQPVYADPLRDITDQIGVRVITYVRSDVAAVAEVLGSQLTVLDDRDLGQETASEGRFGYASRHLQVARNGGPTAQVQVRTVLQHAWAEFEHDIRYKGTVPEEHARDFDRRFTLAAGLLELADQEFTTIRDRLRGGSVAEPEIDADGITPRELAAYLAGQYPDAEWSRTDHYAWIASLLPELDITTLAGLGEVLAGIDADQVTARMDYRYPPGAVRRLDDALLAAFGERYVELPGNAHRHALLATRLERMRGSGPVRRRDAPAPARDRCVLDHLGAGLGVLQRQAGAPLEVADQRRAELRVGRQVGVVGRQAHRRREPVPLLGGDPEVAVVREHPLVAAELVGVGGRDRRRPPTTRPRRARGAPRRRHPGRSR